MSSSSIILAILLVCAVMAIVSASGSVEGCLRKLEKYCRVLGTEHCKTVSATQTFKALADCCGAQCTKDEILDACCF